MVDHGDDARVTANLGERVDPGDALLRRALESLRPVVSFDLAVIFELDADGLGLLARTASGPLALDRVRRNRLVLAHFPTIARALETRRPVAISQAESGSGEDALCRDMEPLACGHACMIVPLYAGERTLGVMTFGRRVNGPYPPAILELAAVLGQLIALAMLQSEQTPPRSAAPRRELARAERVERAPLAGSEVINAFEKLLSPDVQRTVKQARLVAETHVPVLVLGETGVGKELLARAVHNWARGAQSPFVTVNCAAIPAPLLESELFGHVRGAFTGAAATRAGRFVTANGGTLFLDEIGDLPLVAQSALLRVLQEGTFEPVGSDKSVRVDVRIIAATHVELEDAVRAGRFREDLYFRLAVFPLYLPPLRERRDDIAPIALAMLKAIAGRTGRGPWTLSAEALRAIEGELWPGNARQLHNALERATILVPAGELGPAVILPDVRPRRADTDPADEALEPLDDIERRYIAKVVARCDGRLYGERGAAQILGLKPTTLQSRMARLGMRPSPASAEHRRR